MKGRNLMSIQEYQSKISETLEEINLDQATKMASEYFDKPVHQTRQEFAQQIKQELEEGKISLEVKIISFKRETVLERNPS